MMEIKDDLVKVNVTTDTISFDFTTDLDLSENIIIE
jgi:hypothetical protein